MVIARAALGAAVGGAIGAAIWAAIAYGTGYEIGWIAWGIGALAGGGALLLVRDEAEATTGIVAAVVALLAIGVGKYAAVTLTVDSVFTKEIGDSMRMDEESMLVRVADEVIEEWEGAGKKIAWAEGMTIDDADEEADYPKDVWKEAASRWGKMTEEERRAETEVAQQEVDEMMTELRAMAVNEGFKGSFGMFDLLFCGLAVLTAYKMGSGMTSNS